MRNSFRISKSLDLESDSHVISINPVAIYTLPDFHLLSGESNSDLRNKAIRWYEQFSTNELLKSTLRPPGYEEALNIVRKNMEVVDLNNLSQEINVSEKVLSHCINGDLIYGKPVHLSYRSRFIFIEAVLRLGF